MLVHGNSSPRVDIPLYSDILSWFRANQSLLLLINAACLSVKQQILFFLQSLVWPDRGHHFTTDAILKVAFVSLVLFCLYRLIFYVSLVLFVFSKLVLYVSLTVVLYIWIDILFFYSSPVLCFVYTDWYCMFH